MNRKEWILSAVFVAVIVLKLAEAVIPLENWPASCISMFSGLRPRQYVPYRSRLEVTRGSETVTLTHEDFLLSEDEFLGRLRPDSGAPKRCSNLIFLYNRGVSDPSKKITAATIVVEPVLRPGIWNDAGPRTWRCPMPELAPAGSQP